MCRCNPKSNLMYCHVCLPIPKPPVREKYNENTTIKERIINLLNAQCAKGEAKYGHTLDACPDSKFDWKIMAMEELIDLVQYQQKEIMRLERLLNP